MRPHLIRRNELLALLEYAPDRGLFLWRVSQGTQRSGAIAGNIRPDGYRYIKINGNLYRSSRLIWLAVYGRWPREHVDHINGNTSDDRLSNLREASRSQNLGNRKLNKNSGSGFKGVSRRGNKFRGYINKDGVRYWLGVFSSAESAHAAYLAKAREIFGEFARSK